MTDELAMWRDATRDDVIRVLLVDPANLDTVRGELGGVILRRCSLTFGYDTDNRVSGKVTAVDDGSWVEGSWLRIVHECPGYGYRNELATLVPSNVSHTLEDGHVELEFTLQSVLWTLSSDMRSSHLTIAAGAQTPDVFDRMIATAGRAGSRLPGCNSHRYDQAVTYEIGDSILSDLFDVCNAANNRLDVDGHGRVTMGPNTGTNRTPDWRLDVDDARTIVLEQGVTWEDQPGSVASSSIVTYKKDTQDEKTEITAVAELPNSKRYSAQRRGYVLAKVHSESDLTPATYDAALAKAKTYLQDEGRDTVKRTAKCMYFPVTEGQVVEMDDGLATTSNLVTEASVSFDDMTVDLTMEQEV